MAEAAYVKTNRLEDPAQATPKSTKKDRTFSRRKIWTDGGTCARRANRHERKKISEAEVAEHFKQQRDTQVLTQSEVDEKPWKFIGYQGYCSFIASENDFFILRRFASVSARIVLKLQDEVTILEERLNKLDEICSRREGEDVNNGKFRDDDSDDDSDDADDADDVDDADDADKRAEVLEVLESLRLALLKYNEFVLQQAQIKKLPSASTQDVKSLQNWHWNHQFQAVDKAEHLYLSHTKDLFSVVPKEKTPLRRLFEKWKPFRTYWLWKEKTAPELPLYDKDVVNYISDKKIDSFITVLIITVGMAMLIAPMWVLEFLSRPLAKLGTITAFIVVFLGMVSYATVASPSEVLGATAAYSAVLMVFLQLNTPV